MSVALDIDEDYTDGELMYGYQITEDFDDDGNRIWRVWQSSGPISGKHVGGHFDAFTAALAWLSEYIADGEY